MWFVFFSLQSWRRNMRSTCKPSVSQISKLCSQPWDTDLRPYMNVCSSPGRNYESWTTSYWRKTPSSMKWSPNTTPAVSVAHCWILGRPRRSFLTLNAVMLCDHSPASGGAGGGAEEEGRRHEADGGEIQEVPGESQECEYTLSCAMTATRLHAVTTPVWLAGDPHAGPQAEPGLRAGGPGPEEPAAGEGQDAALSGGNHPAGGQLCTCVEPLLKTLLSVCVFPPDRKRWTRRKARGTTRRNWSCQRGTTWWGAPTLCVINIYVLL